MSSYTPPTAQELYTRAVDAFQAFEVARENVLEAIDIALDEVDLTEEQTRTLDRMHNDVHDFR